MLDLGSNQIGDRGLASLLAEPMQGVLPSLHSMYLDDNLLTDSGLSALAAKLSSTALPALRQLFVSGNPASDEAQAVVARAMQPRGRWVRVVVT